MSLQTLISEREARPTQAITTRNHSISFSTLSFPSELSLSFSYCNRQTNRQTEWCKSCPFSADSHKQTQTHIRSERMSCHGKSWASIQDALTANISSPPVSLPHSLTAQLQTYLSAKFVSPAQPGLVLLGSLLQQHQRLFSAWHTRQQTDSLRREKDWALRSPHK